MAYLKPDIYQKSIFEIDYEKLFQKKVTCLIFDLDNTLALISEKTCPKKTKKLIEDLKKKFRVIIISNNIKSRIKKYQEELQIDVFSKAMKPLPFGLMMIKRRYNLHKEEMIMIGDQLITDILSGKLYGIKTILVEPLGKKDLKITKFNRMLESIVLKKYEKNKVFERGKFYE